MRQAATAHRGGSASRWRQAPARQSWYNVALTRIGENVKKGQSA